ncbi:MAG: hypothetical protein WC225_05395 [Acholeplasmataceae bacterium]|nr:hypothetical protein [Acholeplasmataceae bacterium]
MKILVTAFEPFDNQSQNYSYEVLHQIKPSANLVKIVLPVEYEGAFNTLKSIIEKEQFDYLILMGEARSYDGVGFEVIGINEKGQHPDNLGQIPAQRKIIPDGDDGYFSTLDDSLFTEAFHDTNVKSFKSYSAGVYVCNALLYQTLWYLKRYRLKTKCGFIHIPNLANHSKKAVVQGLNQFIDLINQNQAGE